MGSSTIVTNKGGLGIKIGPGMLDHTGHCGPHIFLLIILIPAMDDKLLVLFATTLDTSTFFLLSLKIGVFAQIG